MTLCYSPKHLVAAVDFSQLAQYTSKAQLAIRFKKSNVICFSSTHKKCPKFVWRLNFSILSQVDAYKYLGVHLDRQLSYKQHQDLGQTETKLLFAFKILQKTLSSSSTNYLLKVVAAKFLPSISYGSEMLNTKGSTTLNTAQSSLFKTLFLIPHHIFLGPDTTGIRFKHQILAKQGALAKYYWRMRAAEENTLAHYCWEEVEKQPRQNKSIFRILKPALSALKQEEAWHTSLPYSAFKQITNKAIKQQSLQIDKASLARKRHAWMVIPSYKQLKPQPYLQDHFTDYYKRNLTLLRLGSFQTKDLIPKWQRTWSTTDCRLCAMEKSHYCIHYASVQLYKIWGRSFYGQLWEKNKQGLSERQS